MTRVRAETANISESTILKTTVPPHEILVIITYASNEGSDNPVHLHRLARAFTARTHNVKLMKVTTNIQASSPTR